MDSIRSPPSRTRPGRYAAAVRLLVYEWCTSGGLAGPDARGVVPDCQGADESLAVEGRAMAGAVAADARRDGGFETTLLVDAARPLAVPDPARCLPVPAGREIDMLVAEAALADATIVVAPETAGILARRVRAVRAAGGRHLGCDARFIEVAACKQATAAALSAAGVPVPAGRLLAAGESWPPHFALPAVRKPLDGAGGDGLVVMQPGDTPPSPARSATRVEAFAAGTSVGVSCLAGPAGILPLPPLRQLFAGSPPRYAGGVPLDNPGLIRRAERLAVRAVAAVCRVAGPDSAAGWVGVDMILGEPPDGRGDRVLEINPRLTTSFIGLARGADTSLVRALADAARGRTPRCEFTAAHASAAAFRIDRDADARSSSR